MQSLSAFMFFLVTRKVFKSYLDLYFHVLIIGFFFDYWNLSQSICPTEGVLLNNLLHHS